MTRQRVRLAIGVVNSVLYVLIHVNRLGQFMVIALPPKPSCNGA